jgi:multidrug resistance efflux pump
MSNGEQETENFLTKLRHQPWFIPMVVVIVLAVAGGITYYWITINKSVYIENSMISASLISLAPQSPGVLTDVYVNEGDLVAANTAVAKVGDELIKTKVAGKIISANNDIGQLVNPGEAVVTMIDPTELRVVGQIDENKGLNDIRVGQQVVFKVDAFGSKQYYATVDEISPSSSQTGVLFNISNTRQTNQFAVKARFNIDQYPELKNGMSAKMWVYKN